MLLTIARVALLITITFLVLTSISHAKSRPMLCQQAGKIAIAMAKDFGSEFRPEHYTSPWQQQIGKWTWRCKDDPHGIEQCVRILCETEPS